MKTLITMMMSVSLVLGGCALTPEQTQRAYQRALAVVGSDYPEHRLEVRRAIRAVRFGNANITQCYIYEKSTGRSANQCIFDIDHRRKKARDYLSAGVAVILGMVMIGELSGDDADDADSADDEYRDARHRACLATPLHPGCP